MADSVLYVAQRLTLWCDAKLAEHLMFAGASINVTSIAGGQGLAGSVGVLAAYNSLDALRANHGDDAPYSVIRIEE